MSFRAFSRNYITIDNDRSCYISLPQRGRWQPFGLTDEETEVCTA